MSGFPWLNCPPFVNLFSVGLANELYANFFFWFLWNQQDSEIKTLYFSVRNLTIVDQFIFKHDEYIYLLYFLNI